MSKDLFDDSTMTFGEHLEVLRVHLWKAIIGLALCVVAAFFFSQHVIRWVQLPVTAAMERHFGLKPIDVQNVAAASKGLAERMNDWWARRSADTAVPATVAPAAAPDVPHAQHDRTDQELPGGAGIAAANGGQASSVEEAAPGLIVDVHELAQKLHESMPETYPAPPDSTEPRLIELKVRGRWLELLKHEIKAEVSKENILPRTDTPDEAFMIYMKVSFIVGLVIASPWVFFQLWLFVAAGLYPHERKYVYRYLPMSVVLFLGGALFCFFAVIPFVLDFLFGFNAWLNLRPEMRINSWISFALVMSLMFGLSFQLPLIMLFLEKISIFAASDYRDKRRLAILVIAILSMVLTPSDPVSMMLMMVPLCVLYELGILLCRSSPPKSPFEIQPA